MDFQKGPNSRRRPLADCWQRRVKEKARQAAEGELQQLAARESRAEVAENSRS
jgi:hypothetical protein